MESQIQPDAVESSGAIQFVTEEQVAQSVVESQPEVVESQPPPATPESLEVVESQPVANESVEQTPLAAIVNEETYSNEEVESAVLSYLSDKLGSEFSTLDGLSYGQPEAKIDDRISAIAKFVEDTGRSPQDWFIYQSLNASEMDDMTAVQVKMTSDYPNLSQDEISTLIGSKYNLDPDLHDEGEVKVSALQLKMDAQNAREGIQGMRDAYTMPEQQNEQPGFNSPVNDQWVSDMKKELNNLEAVEFDLGDGKSFSFGIKEDYRGQLAEKNTRLDEYFDPYVRGDGSWDYDALNTHRAVVDNIDSIVQSVYRQGMSDGQRNVVKQAANITAQSPNQAKAPTQGNPLADQIRNAMREDKSWTF
tara:strand:- start:221 stop:1306 length:1086 start_codon:yes stop_codon:yes gene_type:complete